MQGELRGDVFLSGRRLRVLHTSDLRRYCSCDSQRLAVSLHPGAANDLNRRARARRGDAGGGRVDLDAMGIRYCQR